MKTLLLYHVIKQILYTRKIIENQLNKICSGLKYLGPTDDGQISQF